MSSQKIRVADYVVQRLVEHGVRHVFLVTGGGAMHLNDAIAKNPAIVPVCNHHEQASTMAAEGYARITGKTGFVNLTSGPGAINGLNGVFGAWTDSIPMVVVSGQVKRETCMAFREVPGLRQLGFQEADIIPMVRGITKYAEVVRDPESIRYQLERALFLAESPRRGPCWLDIPVDVQGAAVQPPELRGYDPSEDAPRWNVASVPRVSKEILRRIREASRPIILAGSGIRAAGAVPAFRRLAERLRIPVVLSRSGRDLLGIDHRVYCGRSAIDNANRAGNFTVQAADLILALGCRLAVWQTGYDFRAFAPSAYKIQVDADEAELRKPTVQLDWPIHCDVAPVILELERRALASGAGGEHEEWLGWSKALLERFPVVLERHRAGLRLNPYHFTEILSRLFEPDEVVVCGNGSAYAMMTQAGEIRTGQRLFFNSNCASMGHDLPAAIGAAFALGGKRVVCIAGDGSIHMNIQELQTLVHHQLPVKVFVMNNGGYLSMRITQRNFFGRLIGEGPASGMSLPDFVRVAAAYGIPSRRIEKEGAAEAIREVLSAPGPVLADVLLDPEQVFEPKVTSRQLPDGTMVSSPLEDMFPFLDRDELRDIMASALRIPSGAKVE